MFANLMMLVFRTNRWVVFIVLMAIFAAVNEFLESSPSTSIIFRVKMFIIAAIYIGYPVSVILLIKRHCQNKHPDMTEKMAISGFFLCAFSMLISFEISELKFNSDPIMQLIGYIIIIMVPISVLFIFLKATYILIENEKNIHTSAFLHFATFFSFTFLIPGVLFLHKRVQKAISGNNIIRSR